MRRTRRTFLLAGGVAVSLSLVASLALAAGRAPSPAGGRTADAPLVQGSAPIIVGPADPATIVEVSLALRGRDPDGLKQALAELSDPTAPGYGTTMSPAVFGDRFGLPLADEDQLVATLEAQGLTVTQRVPQRTSLTVSGTVAAMGAALGLELAVVRDPVTGHEFVASATPPVVPVALSGSVAGILGLDPRLPVSVQSAADGPPTRGLAPRDLAIAYDFAQLWDQGFTGGGQDVAILQFGVDTDEDLAVFDQAFGISGPAPERIAIGDGLAGAPASFAVEATLDTQVVRAAAPDAQILVYGFPNTTSMTTAVDTIVADGRASMISLSYGRCFMPGEYILPSEVEQGFASFAAAALAGVTMYAASGDWGAFSCHVFDSTDHRETTFWPSCTDNVVSVGGTFLQTREDGTYLSEIGWQDYLITGGGGGGISPSDPMPDWQQGPGVQTEKSNGNRQCPDVSAVADPDTGYIIFVTDAETGEGSWTTVGGTSAAAPLWAGIQALMQQAAAAQGIDQLGFMAPRYYRIAQSTPDAFHDVTRGGNLVDEATPGWDFVSGVGSPNVAKLTDAVIADIAANP